MSKPAYLRMDQKLKGIPASLSESLLRNQTVTAGGRNALTGNCVFLLTLHYLPSLGFAQPVGRQVGTVPSWVMVVGIGTLGDAVAQSRTAGAGRQGMGGFSPYQRWTVHILLLNFLSSSSPIFSPISIPLLIRRSLGTYFGTGWAVV